MRWVFRIIGLILVLIAVAVAGRCSCCLPIGSRGSLRDKFESATGRALTIAGDVRPVALWPNIGVQTASAEHCKRGLVRQWPDARG